MLFAGLQDRMFLRTMRERKETENTMFEAARDLVLKDRGKARKALADEIKRNEKDELDAELDQLEQEAKAELVAEEADAARAQRAADARLALEAVAAKQRSAAMSFDAAIKAANDAFDMLEELHGEVATLSKLEDIELTSRAIPS
ncbi:hypothetical protein RCCS2_04509 [Roseobacter sp. CCS2]|nr:hypothetical protein RCCS2_04509 [Roseobacter sp. CCS2]